MTRIPVPTKEAVKLLLDGSLCLAQIEHNGFKIDTDYLTNALVTNDQKAKELQTELVRTKEYGLWRRKFGENAKLRSGEQLARVLFDVLKFPVIDRSETGKPKTDKVALQRIDLPFVRKYEQWQKCHSIDKFLKAVQNEVVDGFLHPVYNLHTATTYRSSSDSPNSQNWPSRDPLLMRTIRSCFVPRKGRQIAEIDFKGAEVRVAACYNEDPVLINYIKDSSTCMHRDTAMELFGLTVPQVDKKSTRDWSKNRFVFPEFYGSIYTQCAPHLWEVVIQEKDVIPGLGISVKKHLEGQGITQLGLCDPKKRAVPGTFEHRVKKVEDSFWEKRFKVYTRWKNKWWNQYQENGYYITKTGFVIQWGKAGVLSKNDCINYGIQGSSFHCLLWVLIQLQNWIKVKKLKTLIVGQIHDSIILDLVPAEKDEVFAKVKSLIEIDLVKHWDWLIVPMAAEAEIAPVDTPWCDKKEVVL